MARGRATRVWRHSRAHPLSSTLLTVSGLAAAGVAVWAVQHYELLTRTRDALLP